MNKKQMVHHLLLSNWDSALVLNKILIEFRVLFEKFKRGENFSIDSLRKLFGECNGSVTRKWGISDSGQSFEGKFEDADEFLQDLFRMLQIKYPPITDESRTNKFTEYYYSTENEHLDFMRERIKDLEKQILAMSKLRRRNV